MYSSGHGHSSKNQAKTYALLRGLILAKENSVLNIIVVEDPKLIISHAIDKSLTKNIHLRTILIRIQS